MTLRKVPGTLALGLLTSLVAHAALYRGGHLEGGAYHGLLLQAAVAGAVGLLVAFGLLAWSGARSLSDGSILAARLHDRLPGWGGLAASAAIWFGLAEWVEPHHSGAAPWIVLVCLAAVSWLVARLAGFFVRALARLAIAIVRAAFAQRLIPWTPLRRTAPITRRALWVRRRFARPPPIAIALRA